MSIDELKIPKRAFTKQERAWLESVLIPAIKTTRGVPGRNMTISNTDNAQVFNADDCKPCP